LKTKERILATALDLFNEEGEPNVTTNHIADEMDISPGNLYYHYKSKDDIIWQIFLQYEKKIKAVLESNDLNHVSMKDMWLYLNMVFEVIVEYRFLYRNLIQLMNRIEFLKRHFRHILALKSQTALRILEQLRQDGVITADQRTTANLADQIALTSTFWLNYSVAIFDDNFDEQKKLSHGIFHILQMIAPFLDEKQRAFLDELSKQFLS
jgi:AcrR family transcriptional regulator